MQIIPDTNADPALFFADIDDQNLHIHRNTLVYRLKQIKECMEIDINDNGTARELLSFMMMYDIARRHK